MYFNILKTDQHTDNGNSKKRAECNSSERMNEIRDNVEDHRGSPPLLTPETLSYILDNQWVSDDNSGNNNRKKRIKKKNEIIQNLIIEFYKTMEIIDSEKEHKITKELDNDSILQQIRSSEKTLADEKTLEHLVNLLKNCNDNYKQ